ncbi:endo alpha-1,4 polygalactosaminidase [Streptomyces sp. ADMS]|uniref:endo alpha-1,4 polygalactosaminidase n=1 Tax=Streptomyces sp. ADMS TaxID=3071415 RepID=UPI00296E8EE0|nr:endo alpha-1,4 polygalactosaminidase [Streptomyces sp. ADMS]MDW4904980.1 endo alpha-1,4 polygalactosaminidase [Streptomyces sp. ADMS]
MPVEGVLRVGGPNTAVAVLTTVCATLWGLTACGTSPGANNGAEPGPTPSPTAAAEVGLPPLHAGFDYQIGGSYRPPAGVRIVSRDRTAAPAPGLYNICYVNAFQVQPGEEKSWPADLLLRDTNGEVVVDGDWDEALFDIGTAAKRKRIAARVNEWIDGCADKGFDAVEPDNYDSYTRSDDLLTADDATGFITLLSRHAHARGLAIGQKNTVELAGLRKKTGLDFAVAEECGEYDECGEYAEAFDDRVVVIEYTDTGLRKARARFGDRLSIVRRDVDVSTPGSAGYIRRTR